MLLFILSLHLYVLFFNTEHLTTYILFIFDTTKIYVLSDVLSTVNVKKSVSWN
jgi:hypothetical protein